MYEERIMLKTVSFFVSPLLLAVCVTAASAADQDPAELLAKTEAMIKKSPDAPQLHYRRAQLLARLGKYDESYAAAETALAKYVKANHDLAWLLLESIDAGDHRVDVHFNMGPAERRRPDTGIVRPLSFRIWTKARDPALADIIDFELGYIGGKPLTAAFGKTTGGMHLNFGMSDPKLPYSKIRQQAIELIQRRFK
jgi:hypothetical protein